MQPCCFSLGQSTLDRVVDTEGKCCAASVIIISSRTGHSGRWQGMFREHLIALQRLSAIRLREDILQWSSGVTLSHEAETMNAFSGLTLQTWSEIRSHDGDHFSQSLVYHVSATLASVRVLIKPIPPSNIVDLVMRCHLRRKGPFPSSGSLGLAFSFMSYHGLIDKWIQASSLLSTLASSPSVFFFFFN